mmetsp:Transcript_29610/g.40887  ORF Transcript_29610/g.40887 Transcript_29610/m.40887 type:complete len:389 (+) Transcript_29610:28-1194(+)
MGGMEAKHVRRLGGNGGTFTVDGCIVGGNGITVIGNYNYVSGNACSVYGNYNFVSGNFCSSYGVGNVAQGNGCNSHKPKPSKTPPPPETPCPWDAPKKIPANPLPRGEPLRCFVCRGVQRKDKETFNRCRCSLCSEYNQKIPQCSCASFQGQQQQQPMQYPPQQPPYGAPYPQPQHSQVIVQTSQSFQYPPQQPYRQQPYSQHTHPQQPQYQPQYYSQPSPYPPQPQYPPQQQKGPSPYPPAQPQQYQPTQVHAQSSPYPPPAQSYLEQQQQAEIKAKELPEDNTKIEKKCPECGFLAVYGGETLYCSRCGSRLDGQQQISTPESTPPAPSTPAAESSQMECVVCMDAAKCVLLFPCMHLCLCEGCSVTITICPLCQVQAQRKEKVFL